MSWEGVLIPPFAPCRNVDSDRYDEIFPDRPKHKWETSDRETSDDGYGPRLQRELEAQKRNV